MSKGLQIGDRVKIAADTSIFGGHIGTIIGRYSYGENYFDTFNVKLDGSGKVLPDMMEDDLEYIQGVEVETFHKWLAHK